MSALFSEFSSTLKLISTFNCQLYSDYWQLKYSLWEFLISGYNPTSKSAWVPGNSLWHSTFQSQRMISEDGWTWFFPETILLFTTSSSSFRLLRTRSSCFTSFRSYRRSVSAVIGLCGNRKRRQRSLPAGLLNSSLWKDLLQFVTRSRQS